MSNEKASSGGFNAVVAALAILIALIVCNVVFYTVFGMRSNFHPEDEHHPINVMGNMYMGGWLVPIIMSVVVIVITFAVERALTVSKAYGRGNVNAFVMNIKKLVANGDIDNAITECDQQQGSLANVVRAGLEKYKHVSNETGISKEDKVAAIQKDLEEATSLELPMLSKNLSIISTCASISTLLGLLGTVFGMIRSFAALANAGAPDTAALSAGISEALWNTALGIGGSCLAIIVYNFFTTKIDSLTHGMDEAGFSIVQTFSEKGK